MDVSRKPWLSTKDWRRSLRIARERGLSTEELRSLQARLARVRVGAPRLAPALRVVQGGRSAGAGPSAPSPGPRRAA